MPSLGRSFRAELVIGTVLVAAIALCVGLSRAGADQLAILAAASIGVPRPRRPRTPRTGSPGAGEIGATATAIATPRSRADQIGSDGGFEAAEHAEAIEPSDAIAPTEAIAPEARAILDASPDACVLLSKEGTILWANKAARDQFGIFGIGNPFSFTLRVPELVAAVADAARTGRPGRASWSEKVPTSRWYEAFVAPCDLAAGEAPERRALAVFMRDLTEQKRLDRMREDFVANASHELRTPLTALTGFIETLQGPAKNDAPKREQFLGVMREQAERMRRLTDALLSLSRVEMRAHVRPTELVDCVAATRYAVEMTRGMAREHGVALELSVLCEPLVLRGDHDELVQVIDNLVENAIKYGGEGGRVLISADRDAAAAGDVAVIAVQDFGPGIPPEHVPRLVERFYRVDVQASRARQGTGLGLAIVKHIVARHRGRLTVKSELGAGSTFTVRLPMEPPPDVEHSVRAPD